MDEVIIPRFIPAGTVDHRPPIETKLEYPMNGGLRLMAKEPDSEQWLVLFAIYPDGTCERWPGLKPLEGYGLQLVKPDCRLKERE